MFDTRLTSAPLASVARKNSGPGCFAGPKSAVKTTTSSHPARLAPLLPMTFSAVVTTSCSPVELNSSAVLVM